MAQSAATLKTAALALLVMLAGCKQEERIYYVQDPKALKETFMECLAKVPRGPSNTVYNDWDEVVVECRRAADWLTPHDVATKKHPWERGPL